RLIQVIIDLIASRGRVANIGIRTSHIANHRSGSPRIRSKAVIKEERERISQDGPIVATLNERLNRFYFKVRPKRGQDRSKEWVVFVPQRYGDVRWEGDEDVGAVHPVSIQVLAQSRRSSRRISEAEQPRELGLYDLAVFNLCAERIPDVAEGCD